MMNDHDFIFGFKFIIFDLAVVVRYFTILVDFILFNLRLLLLTY